MEWNFFSEKGGSISPFFPAHGNYVKIRTGKGSYMAHEKMHAYEEKLRDKGFLWIHRSYLVPFSKIDRIVGEMAIVAEKELPIGERYEGTLYQKLYGKG